MDLSLIITIEQDLSALKSRPAQVRAVVQRESKVWAPETVADIRLRSSMKAHSKGNSVVLVVNLGTLTCTFPEIHSSLSVSCVSSGLTFLNTYIHIYIYIYIYVYTYIYIITDNISVYIYNNL